MNVPANKPANRMDCLTSIRIIWASMLASLAVYAWLGLALGEELRVKPPLPWPEETWLSVFYGIAILLFAAILLFRHWFTTDGANTISQPVSGNLHAGSDKCSRYLVFSLVIYALAEAIALVGLVLCLITGETKPLMVLLGIALAALWLYRPSRDELELVNNARRFK